MNKEIFLTPIAKKDLEKIITYLTEFWDIQAASNFLNRFEQISSLIKSYPEIYPFVSKEKEIRKCILTKHNIIYFKLSGNTIQILAIFDTRQNPEKLSF